jgi:hypothetical protein
MLINSAVQDVSEDHKQGTHNRLAIMKGIRRDTGMTPSERLVGEAIVDRTDDDLHGGTRYKIPAATIATELGLSLRTVQSAIRTLKKRGWLVRRRRHFTAISQNVEPSMRACRQRLAEGRENREVVRADRHAMRAELSHPVHLVVSNDNGADLKPGRRRGFASPADLQLFVDTLAKALASHNVDSSILLKRIVEAESLPESLPVESPFLSTSVNPSSENLSAKSAVCETAKFAACHN